jgi:SpoVK/Ycf46/Vps4 family AAA+-type ATPase
MSVQRTLSHSVTDFTTRLEALHKRNADIAQSMSSYPDLLEALRDLDGMIGMDEAKSSIILQLESLVVKVFEDTEHQISKTPTVFDNQMLHTVITGPPGVGKTELGKILARIWKALGILKGKSNLKKKDQEEEDLYDIYRYALRKSQEALISPLRDLNSIARELSIINRTKNNFKLERCAEELVEIQHDTVDTIQKISLTDRSKKNPPKKIVPFKVVSRVDLVAGYVGQTAIKTEELLKECLGGVVFIDEAYSLIHGEKDDFGMEALTTLNQFMSEHPNEIIVIFAGYKSLMDEGIFRKQPGLKSRCSWYINVKGYTGEDLAKIFRYQLEKNDWTIDSSINLGDFFQKNLRDFPDYGRNTSKFLFYCKLYHMDAEFERITGSKKRKIKPTRKFTEDTLEIALKKYKLNHVGQTDEKPPPFGFYT